MNVQCSICKDVVNVLKEGNEALKTSALSCGHVFHSDCIIRWIDQSGCPHQGTCPQCRSFVTKKNALRLFFDLVPMENYQDEATTVRVNELERVVQYFRDRLSRQTQINFELRERKSELELNLESALKNSDVLKEKLLAQRSSNALTIARLKLTKKSKELDDAKHEMEKLRQKVTSLKRMWNRILNGPSKDDEVREVLEELDQNDMALVFLSYKKDSEELSRCRGEARKLRKDLIEALNQISALNRIVEVSQKPKLKAPEPNSVGPSTSSSSVDGMLAGPSTAFSQAIPLSKAPVKRKLASQSSHPWKAVKTSSDVSSAALGPQLTGGASAIPDSNGGTSKMKTEQKKPGVRKPTSLLNRPPWL